MSNKPLVSVIVTTKNEKMHIENCLESISQQSYKNIEIVLVDNNSTDNTKKLAKKYTPLVFNIGPERSVQRNFGAKKAKGIYLLFVDADMILSKNVVKECVKKFEEDKIAGLIIPEKSIGKGFWTRVKAFERSLYEGDPSIEAARFFTSQVFREVGGYDENITGPEDWDLPKRVKEKYKIGRIKSFIEHNEGNISLFTLMKKKHYYGLRTSKYISKHPLHETAQQVIYLLRPAIYRNWRKLYKNPSLTAGMIVMLFLEQLAGLSGFVKGALHK